MRFILTDGRCADFTPSTLFPGVFIETQPPARPDFFTETEADLRKLMTTHSGRWLRTSIIRYCSGEKVILVRHFSGGSWTVARTTHLQAALYRCKPRSAGWLASLCQRRADGGRAEGSAAEIFYDSCRSFYVDDQGHCSLLHTWRDNQFLVLFHELIHACRMLKGNSCRWPSALGGVAPCDEELRTVGLGPWADKMPSENSLRRELGLPLRQSYWSS